MEQYIPKSILLAEIDRVSDNAEKVNNTSYILLCNHLKDFINTIVVKEVDLTWQDIQCIAETGNDFMNSEESDDLTEEEYYTAILDKFKKCKHFNYEKSK